MILWADECPILTAPFNRARPSGPMLYSSSLVTQLFTPDFNLHRCSNGPEIISSRFDSNANTSSSIEVVASVVLQVRLPVSYLRIPVYLTLVKDHRLLLHQACKAANPRQALRHASHHYQHLRRCHNRSRLTDHRMNL